MSRQLRLPIALAALLLAGAANAQPLDLRLPDRATAIAAAPLGTVGHEAPRPAPDLANPLDPLAPTTRLATPLAGAVFAKTAIDHRFGRRDDLTGSLGFLCGLQPGHHDSGGAAAYGVDPHGRFVGAKFSLAFR
jgi:hypothetical protein